MPQEEWEARWSDGRIGFDQSRAHPALVDLILGEKGDKLRIPTKGRAVVPGCGRGYDVELLAKRGLDAVGVDISPTGVQAAQAWLDGREPVQGRGSMDVICTDYFEWTHGVAGDWDVLLDYTFLCALPPSMRQAWSSALSTLARLSSSTRLITLMYPLPSPSTPAPGPDDRKGPPYALTVEEYHRLLDDKWELIYCEDVPAEQMRKSGAAGGEKVGVWAWR